MFRIRAVRGDAHLLLEGVYKINIDAMTVGCPKLLTLCNHWPCKARNGLTHWAVLSPLMNFIKDQSDNLVYSSKNTCAVSF